MSPAPNQCRRPPPLPPRKPHPLGPNPKPNPCQPNLPTICSSEFRCYVTIFLYDISCQGQFRAVRQVTIGLKLASSTAARTLRPRWTSISLVCPHLRPG